MNSTPEHNIQKNRSKTRYVWIVGVFVVGALVFGVSYFDNLGLFQGNLTGENCISLPQEDSEKLIALESKLEDQIAEAGNAYEEFEKNLIARDAIENVVGSNMKVTSEESCQNAAAYVNDVLDLPENHGLCIQTLQDVDVFMQTIKQESTRVAIKDQAVILAQTSEVLNELSEDNANLLAEISQTRTELQGFQVARSGGNFCEIAALENKNLL